MRQPAQDALEYALLLSLLALVVLIGVGAIGDLIQNWFGQIVQRVTTQP